MWFKRWLEQKQVIKHMQVDLEFWTNMSNFWEGKYRAVVRENPEIFEQKGAWVHGQSDKEAT